LRFEPASLDVAENAYRQRQAELRHWLTRLALTTESG
jgi:hypothetical protein